MKEEDKETIMAVVYALGNVAILAVLAYEFLLKG